MTIHMLINCYWGNGISGGDKRSLEFLKRWQNQGHDIIIYTTSGYKKLLDQTGITEFPIILVDSAETENTGIIQAYMQRTRNCRRMMHVKAGDILYSPTDIMPDVLPCFYYKLRFGKKVRWVIVNHHIFETFYKRPGKLLTNLISNAQQRFCLFLAKHFADCKLTVSTVVYAYMKKHHWDMNKVYLAGNGIDTKFIRETPVAENGYDAVFLARLNNSKGIFELPEIWKRVNAGLPEAELAIIGTGPEENINRLKAQIKDLGEEKNIKLLGYLESEEIYGILKKSKTFLFTSHEEGWGVAIAEAMACGLPVVAYNLPVYKDVFAGMVRECPLLDVDKMAQEEIKLLSGEDTRRKLGEKCQEMICGRYSLDKVAAEEMKLLLGL